VGNRNRLKFSSAVNPDRGHDMPLIGRPPAGRRRRHLCAIYRLLSFCLFSISERAESCTVEHFLYTCLVRVSAPIIGRCVCRAPGLLLLLLSPSVLCTARLSQSDCQHHRTTRGIWSPTSFLIDLAVESRMLLNIGDIVCEYN